MKRFYKFVDVMEEVRRVLGGTEESVTYDYKTTIYRKGDKEAKVERMYFFDDETDLGNIYTLVN